MTVIYEKTQINEVIEKLKEGKVIAFPTDTVYGLGVRYHDEEALTRLKQAKGRPQTKSSWRQWRISMKISKRLYPHSFQAH
mgnify:CR=1 FL=1